MWAKGMHGYDAATITGSVAFAKYSTIVEITGDRYSKTYRIGSLVIMQTPLIFTFRSADLFQS
jgi:hypothetical protein